MWILIVVLLSTLKLLQKSDRPKKNGNTFPDPVNNPSVYQLMINKTVFCDDEHTSNIFQNPYNLWDTDPAAPKSPNHTYDRDSMSNQYLQTTTHHPRTNFYPVFFSLLTMDSKKKGLRVSFAFFQKNYLPDGRVKKTVATDEELSHLRNPGAMDGVSPFVMNCSCI